MERICKQCGNILSEEANFCDECGSKWEVEEVDLTEKENDEPMQESQTKGFKKKICKFIFEYKNFKELTLVNKILHVVIPIVCLILLFNIFGGGYTYKSVEEFQEAFCYNIGEEYSSDEWAFTSAEESDTEYDIVAYDNGGSLMVIAYCEDDEVVAVGLSVDMRYMDFDTEFMWKVAMTSAMLGCDMEETDEIVREANLSSSYEGEEVTELNGGVEIHPYAGSYENCNFFMITTERYDG